MSKKNSPDLAQDLNFAELFNDVKPIKHDRYEVKPNILRRNKVTHQKKSSNVQKKSAATFEFSDGFEAYFSANSPLQFRHADCPKERIRALRRGDIEPELLLDLHGLNQEASKQEIAALLYAASKQHIECVCIVHGHGNGILKQSVPNWLVQHPDTLGFHQAPLKWGGKGALLVLVANQQDQLSL